MSLIFAFRLADCELSDKSCITLARVLQSENSVIHLDLSYNNLGDSGVQILSKGLSSPRCVLQTLRLVISLYCISGFSCCHC